MRPALPYAFLGLNYAMSLRHIKTYNIVPYQVATESLGTGLYSQFSHIFTNVIQSYQDNDLEYLKNVLSDIQSYKIMEPKLFKASSDSLSQMKEQGLKLKYMEDPDANIGEEQSEDKEEKEEDTSNKLLESVINIAQTGDARLNNDKFPFAWEEKDMKINIGFKGTFGLRILRHENDNKKFLKIPSAQFAERQYYFDLNNLMGTYENQILIANVIFKTTRRLLLLKDDEVVEGDQDQEKFLYHKWRFETYIPEPDWILTDIDDTLKGNTYNT